MISNIYSKMKHNIKTDKSQIGAGNV